MDRNKSFEISAKIGNIIAGEAPRVRYTENELKNNAEPEFLQVLQESGCYDGDYEKFYVIHRFCQSYGLINSPKEYLIRLFTNAQKMNADRFEADDYLKNIKFPKKKEGDVFFTTASYARGEIFQYAMPDLFADIVVPKLGFFTRKVEFPTVYEGNMPWISVCPSEVSSMAEGILNARGKVLVLGLGLGYYTYMISKKREVTDITVVDISDKIIDIFNRYVFGQFPKKGKIKIINGDAIAFMQNVKEGEYDYIYSDIWEGVVDGAPLYTKIKTHETRLASTKFDYWIKEQIEAYIQSEDLK